MASDIKCPICGGKTALRTRRSDKLKFYVCANFPKCKGQVAQDDVYWVEEEPQPIKNEPSKEVEKVESTGGVGTGIGALVIGLICGIAALISVFLPWCIAQPGGQYADGTYWQPPITMSGWMSLNLSNYWNASFPYTYLVLGGSVVMIVFASCAIITALSTKSKGGKITFAWIAVAGGLIAVIASLWAMIGMDNYNYSNLHEKILVSIDISYGLTLCAIVSIVGLLGFVVAEVKIIKAKHR